MGQTHKASRATGNLSTGCRTCSCVHRLYEAIKQIAAIVRARSRLRVILHGEYWTRFVRHALDRAVVQIHVGHAQLDRPLDPRARASNGKAVVLRGDLDDPCLQVLHRVVPTAVAVGKLVRRSAEGANDELESQADTEHRQAGIGKDAYLLGSPGYGCRISGTVGHEDAARIGRQNGLDGRYGRHDDHGKAVVADQFQGSALDPIVEADDTACRGIGLFERVRRRSRHLRRQLPAVHRRLALHPLHGLRLFRRGHEEPGTHGPQLSDVSRDGPRVDTDQGRNLVTLQVGWQSLAPTRGRIGKAAQNEAGHPRPTGLVVLRLGPVVAYHRSGHHDDLSGEGGIGQDLLITGMVRGKDRLPNALCRAGEEPAVEASAILEEQVSVRALRSDVTLRSL